jgi:predicted ribosome quality control (RQC) complex YloA/Tae2 family protein
MITDPNLIERLAAELDHRLRGRRLTDAGLAGDGTPALAFGKEPEILLLDLFAPTPIVRFEALEISLEGDPGYLRAIATALRGMRVERIGVLPGERILTIDFTARSRFGVVDAYRLVAELIPKFGNVLLLKDHTIVAAAKQFGPAENKHRAILVGGRYAPPPPRPARVKPPDRAQTQPPDGLSVLDAARAHAALRLEGDERDAVTRRRAALRKRIERRISALREERARLIARRNDAAGRDRLRAEGDALYAFGHLVPAGAARFTAPTDPHLDIELDPGLDAKGNAAEIFGRYRKLADGLPHVERRIAHVDATLATLEELEWQLESGDAAVIRDVAGAFGEGEGARPRKAPQQKRRRAPLQYDLPSGARIYVGRSPQENADVTFRVARPSDLWFHAREQPGAHVVLQVPPGRDASNVELDAAAGAAAFYSKAKTSDRVAIDYVERKHVRKQRNAPAGRVWYTNAQTLFVRPRDPASYVASAS